MRLFILPLFLSIHIRFEIFSNNIDQILDLDSTNVQIFEIFVARLRDDDKAQFHFMLLIRLYNLDIPSAVPCIAAIERRFVCCGSDLHSAQHTKRIGVVVANAADK